MSIRRRLNTYSTRVSVLGWPQRIMVGLAFLAAPVATFAQNPNCTLIVPNNPLTAHGLATPYQLVATKPADGPCHEATKVQAAFVQAAVIDLTTGHISIYNPLVIDAGTTPAVAPVVPQLPLFNVVALWFGYNGDDLTLVGANPSVLAANDCHQDMGQFAYCNAPAFFASAGFELLINNLSIPPLGTGHDGRPCPSVRSFAAVDQDQSDNLPTTYLITPAGKLAQNTAANAALFPTAKTLANASDNRLVDVFLDGALGCTPWTAPDLANPGHSVPALPLNELQASQYQAAPVALIPLGNPFALNSVTGLPDIAKVNEYRAGVGQLPAIFAGDASQTTYCSNVRSVARQSLMVDRLFFVSFASPDVTVANNLFTFMANRLAETYQNLNCQPLLNLPVPVTLTKDVNGVVIDAIIL
jgi:hypothetical protein